MGCTHTVQCLISEDIVRESESVMESDSFGSFAELANFAIRLYSDAIRFGFTGPPYVRKKGTIRRNVRIEQNPMDYLRENCNLKNQEIADYALDWYLNSFRNGRMEPTPAKVVG